MRKPTLKDVAEAAGVHSATASRALNPDTRAAVNAETARRVLKAAESLGYRANPIARSLKTARTRTVGLLIPDLTNPLFPPIVRGADDVLSERGYTRADRQHRQRPRKRTATRGFAGFPSGRRPHRRHRAPGPSAARAVARRGHQDRADQPAQREPRRPLRGARRRVGCHPGCRAPRAAGPHPHRTPGRPAHHVDRRGPVAGVPARGARRRRGRRRRADR